PYLSIAIRSTPMPKAKPEIFSGSYPLRLTKSKTFGSTMPQPSISIHPVCLHGRHGALSLPRLPLPPHTKHDTNISALGSVKGKNDGRKLVFTSDPNSAFIARSSVPFKSPKVMLVST